MSKTAVVFFTLFLVFTSCFIAGCSSLPSSGTPEPTEQTQKVDVGFSAGENTVLAQRYRSMKH